MRLEQFLQEEDIITEGILDLGIFKSSFFAGTPGCFDEETLICTENGYKKISEVQVGENVLTYNEDTGENEWKPVEEQITFDVNKEILQVEFENGEKVICTEDHEFYRNGEWIKAKDL